MSPSKTNPTIGPIEQGIYLRQGNGMAPEVRWQSSEPARSGGGDFRAPGEDSVETLLRRLIRRIEERYPPRGGAPEQPPLPEIELVWERPERPRGRWLGYVVALLAGGALTLAASLQGWLG